jgi:tape measure domain-containing protein
MSDQTTRFRFVADDKVSKSLKKIDKTAKKSFSTAEGASKKYSKQTDKAARSTKKVSGGMGRMLSKANLLKGALTALAVVALKKAITGAVKLGAEMEKTQLAFNTFLGSAKLGKEVISELNEFSNITPFDNEQVIKAGKSLLAANVPANKLTETLTRIGDISAGASIPITDLSNIYAKAMNKGKLQAEELNQMAERGIPIIDELSKTMNITKKEVFDFASKGKITSDIIDDVFKSMTSEGGKFHKLMQKQSQTTSGLFSTLQGKLQLTGIAMFKHMKPGIDSVVKGLIGLADKTREWVEIDAADEIKKERDRLNLLSIQIRSANLSEEERLGILKEMEEINPKITDGIDKENISLGKLNDNMEEYNKLAVKKMVMANLEEKQEKYLARISRLEVKKADQQLKLAEAVSEYLHTTRGNTYGMNIDRLAEKMGETPEGIRKQLSELDPAEAAKKINEWTEKYANRQSLLGTVPMGNISELERKIKKAYEDEGFIDLNKMIKNMQNKFGGDDKDVKVKVEGDGGDDGGGILGDEGTTLSSSRVAKNLTINIEKVVDENGIIINDLDFEQSTEEMKDRLLEVFRQWSIDLNEL